MRSGADVSDVGMSGSQRGNRSDVPSASDELGIFQAKEEWELLNRIRNEVEAELALSRIKIREAFQRREVLDRAIERLGYASR